MKFAQKRRKLKFHKLWNSILVKIKKGRGRLGPTVDQDWLGRVWPNTWLRPTRQNFVKANSTEIWPEPSRSNLARGLLDLIQSGLTRLKFDQGWLDPDQNWAESASSKIWWHSVELTTNEIQPNLTKSWYNPI